MKIAKILKNLKQINKKDEDFGAILSDVLAQAAESQFDQNYCEIQVSRNLWGYDWTYFKNSQGKKMDSSKFYDQRQAISKEKGEEGVKLFEKEYTEVYDPKVYENQIQSLNVIGKKLNKMGFKFKIQYSKNYKKCNLKNEPESIWLLVSW